MRLYSSVIGWWLKAANTRHSPNVDSVVGHRLRAGPPLSQSDGWMSTVFWEADIGASCVMRTMDTKYGTTTSCESVVIYQVIHWGVPTLVSSSQTRVTFIANKYWIRYDNRESVPTQSLTPTHSHWRQHTVTDARSFHGKLLILQCLWFLLCK